MDFKDIKLINNLYHIMIMFVLKSQLNQIKISNELITFLAQIYSS